MNAPEDNPADDAQPTKEEWEAFEKAADIEAATPITVGAAPAVCPMCNQSPCNHPSVCEQAYWLDCEEHGRATREAYE